MVIIKISEPEVFPEFANNQFWDVRREIIGIRESISKGFLERPK